MDSTLKPPAEWNWTWRMALVLACAGVLFFARLGQRALWSEELRWAEIPREMQRESNYLWPTINGQTYYDKPLGSYWLVLLASHFGGSVDEWAARCPSAASGVLGVLLLMLVARRLYDEPTAVLAGLILATSFSYVFFSRHASTDVETVTGFLACLWLFLRNRQHPGGWWTLWLWLFMALTSLTKGLLGFVLPLLIIGAYSTLTPSPNEPVSPVGIVVNRNRWLFNKKAFLAIPLGVLLYLSPFLLSFVMMGSAEGFHMVYRENIRRFFDPVNHRGPIYLYLYVIFALMAPWSLLLPAALVQMHEAAPVEADQRDSKRFVLVFFWATFLFFSLSSSRRSYYLLPILPAGSLLIGRLLTHTRETLSWRASLLLKAGYALLALVAVASLALLLPGSWMLPAPWDHLPRLPHPWVFGIMWFTWITALAWTVFRWRSPGLAQSLAWISASFMAYLFLLALPSLEIYRTQKPFGGSVKEALGAETQSVALFRHRDLVYYLDQPRPLTEYTSPEALAEAIKTNKVRWLILRRSDVAAIPVASKTLAAETVYPWETEMDAGRKLLLVELCR